MGAHPDTRKPNKVKVLQAEVGNLNLAIQQVHNASVEHINRLYDIVGNMKLTIEALGRQLEEGIEISDGKATMDPARLMAIRTEIEEGLKAAREAAEAAVAAGPLVDEGRTPTPDGEPFQEEEPEDEGS